MAVVRILEPGDVSSFEHFLRPLVDSSLFLLSNSRQAGLVDRGRLLEGTYYAAFDGGKIAGVVAHYWQGNVVLQAPACLEELIAAILSAPVRPIQGLLGPADQVGRAFEILAWDDVDVQLDEQEGLYALELEKLIVPEELRSDRLCGRRIERGDLDRVAAWRLAFWLEALGAEETEELREQCRQATSSSIERGDTWVLEDLVLEDLVLEDRVLKDPTREGGELVATTSFNAATDEAVQVGGVWTPPELRGRGYGRAAVAVSLLDAREGGTGRAILFTGEDNRPAIRAYAALGFERIGDYRIVLRRPGGD